MALTDNLVSYYKLDGNSTDIVGAKNGTDTSITYSIDNGKIVQGAGFNGSSSKIDVSLPLNLNNNFTINLWMKYTSNFRMELVNKF